MRITPTVRHILNRGLTLALACALMSCSSTQSADTSAAPVSAGSVGSVDEPVPVNDDLLADLERRYVIGPASARTINYRIDWQHGPVGDGFRLLSIQDDSVFILDKRNFLTRVRIEDGSRVWRVPAVAPIDEVFGITFIGQRVFVTTGGALIVLDAGTGTQVAKQRFTKIANTAPYEFDQFLIYGSRDGQIVWHAYQIGHQWRGYKVSQSINVPPVLSDGFIVAVGNDGIVMALNAASATQYWSRQLLDEVVAPPTVGNGAVYVAGLDQHLRAIDLRSGRYLWRVLTESPLSDQPALIGSRLYQQIPDTGLVCFEARPKDSPGGKKIWTSTGVNGSVIFKRREYLYTWDTDEHRLMMLDDVRGGVVQAIDLPQVSQLTVTGESGENIFAASTDGRVVRLVPRN